MRTISLVESISTENCLQSVTCGPEGILLCLYWFLSLSLGLFYLCLSLSLYLSLFALWRPLFLLPVLSFRKTHLSRCVTIIWQGFKDGVEASLFLEPLPSSHRKGEIFTFCLLVTFFPYMFSVGFCFVCSLVQWSPAIQFSVFFGCI